MPRIMQTSLSGGELAPSLHSHADLQKYTTGLALCENYLVQAQGGIANRAGFEFILSLPDAATSTARLIPFQYNTEQAYVLIFTNLKMRVVRNGGVVLDSLPITGATQANPVEITSVGHGLSTGASIYITDVLGMTEINDTAFTVTSTGADTFTLDSEDGTGHTAYTSGGSVTRAITGATAANPVSITCAAHGYSTGDQVFLDNVGGMTEINGRFYTITSTGANTFTLDGENGTTHTTYTSGGTSGRVYVLTTPYPQADLFRLKYTQSADIMTITHPTYQQRELSRFAENNWSIDTISFASSASAPSAGLTVGTVGTDPTGAAKTYRYVLTTVDENGSESVASAIQTSGSISALAVTWGVSISWTTVTGADYYNIYKENALNSGIFGWIGEADEDGSPTYEDYNQGPDMSVTPPIATNPFDATDKYPSCVTYHQQRLSFGATNNSPQTVWLSRTADFDNMDVSRPQRADDGIEATLASRQVNEIRHLVSLDELLIFTSGGEWKAVADENGILTPSNFNFKSQGFRGSSHVPPVIIGETALFVQERGSRIRDLAYKFEDDKYTGNDLTILSRHMFEGKQIVDWTYSQEPYSIVWAVRDDGQLLALTYLREHEISAWTRCVTDGTVESVTSVSEGNENILYAVVKRNIDGSDVRYIERMKERLFTTIEDAFFVDAGLTYDGASTNTVTGLQHLEGETVVALADGNVVENLTVTNGQITLVEAASKIHVGLPYNCDFKTLEVSFEGGVIQSRRKQVARVALRVQGTRGLAVGRDTDSLFEFKERSPVINYDSIAPLTGEQRLEMTPTWSDKGEIYVRQRYPLPATILAIIPEVEVSE